MIAPATPADYANVAAHMRAVDAREQFACRFAGDDTPEALAREMATTPAIHSVCSYFGVHGVPVAILSAYLVSPGVARLHRIATDDWPRVSLKLFRYGIEVFMPALSAVVHRAECSVLAEHDEARDILQRLGFAFEGLARARGRNGEDFAQFGWVRRPHV